ncbi:MAG: HEAT repeat domain-containing protein, partial [Kiritimatiellales bacterium]|nr:HEAT repeat domain-containing protein [Kiritimatiellales bacterium]
MRRKTVMGLLLGSLMLTTASAGVKMEHIEKWESAGNVKKLIKTTKHMDLHLRFAAIEALGRLKDESAVEPLGSLLSDDAMNTTDAAIKALVAIGSDSTNKQLIKALSLQSASARILAADALGNRKNNMAVDALILTLQGKPDKVATSAAIALGKIADPKSTPALKGRIKFGSAELKLACANALSNIGGIEAAEGLVPIFGDLNKQVRQVAVDTFVDLGAPALDYAYEAVKDDETLVRTTGLAIYEGLDILPNEGDQAVWYLLAKTTTANRKTVDREAAAELANQRGDTVSALAQALQDGDPMLRETARCALEMIGKPASERVLETALTKAKPAAKKWLESRVNWHGAPSWRLDLWASATALSPVFKCEKKWTDALQAKGVEARKAMASEKLKPRREYVPLLIAQFSSSPTKTSSSQNTQETIDFFGLKKRLGEEDSGGETTFVAEGKKISGNKNKAFLLAMNRLTAMGEEALSLLIAALNDNDPQVANACAAVLGKIGDERAIAPLLEQLEKRTAEGECLFRSPFYTSLQELGYT